MGDGEVVDDGAQATVLADARVQAAFGVTLQVGALPGGERFVVAR